MILVIVAAEGDIKKNYCLLLFMFDDVFLKRDGSLENMKILSNYYNHKLSLGMKLYNPIKTILHKMFQGTK
jgi:hypothetical protein